jgi:hypothetical protein
VACIDIRSVVVAGVGDLQDNSNVLPKVLLRSSPTLQLLGYLLALIRRRVEESTQHGLRRRRCVQLRGSCRRLRVQCRQHLRVIACGVDDRTQIGICGRDAAPAVNDNARPPTAATSLVSDSVTICEDLSNQRTAES